MASWTVSRPQIETMCLDIAFALGGRFVSFGDLLAFNFSAMSQEGFERRVEHAAASRRKIDTGLWIGGPRQARRSFPLSP